MSRSYFVATNTVRHLLNRLIARRRDRGRWPAMPPPGVAGTTAVEPSRVKFRQMTRHTDAGPGAKRRRYHRWPVRMLSRRTLVRHLKVSPLSIGRPALNLEVLPGEKGDEVEEASWAEAMVIYRRFVPAPVVETFTVESTGKKRSR